MQTRLMGQGSPQAHWKISLDRLGSENRRSPSRQLQVLRIGIAGLHLTHSGTVWELTRPNDTNLTSPPVSVEMVVQAGREGKPG